MITEASPMRPDFVAAVEKAMAPGLSGRAGLPGPCPRARATPCGTATPGAPSYGASPMFIKNSEDFSHGLNERTPLSNLRPAIDYYLVLVKELAG